MPAHAFDELAVDRDADLTETVAGRAVRAGVRSRHEQTFGPEDRVLEPGGGKGEDAVGLAQHRVRVVATDAACPLIEMARRSARRQACGGAIGFHVEATRLAATQRP